MYKMVIIAEPARKIVLDLVDTIKCETIGRTEIYQPELIDILELTNNIYKIDQFVLCGSKVYTAKIKSDIVKAFPKAEVKES